VVFSITNPIVPQRIGGYDTTGVAQTVVVSGSCAYVADGTAGLQVIDVSNPSNPHRVGGCSTGTTIVGVAVSGDFAYLGDSGKLYVVDVTAPANPRPIGVNRLLLPRAFTIADDKLYAVSQSDGLVILHLHRYARFDNVRFQPGSLSFDLSGPPATPGTLQRSSDLLHWDNWFSFTFPEGSTNLTAPTIPGQPTQFYRTVVP
jgi:hypothetical protein